jgi:hypothetical protein
VPTAAYIELLDWTARQIVNGKRGVTPDDAPPIFERLKIKPTVWFELVTRFGKLFSLVAGQPHRVDEFRGHLGKKRYPPPSRPRIVERVTDSNRRFRSST